MHDFHGLNRTAGNDDDKETIVGDQKTPRLKPFLRWAGGKQQYLNDLIHHLELADAKTYYEPFLGGGSASLSLKFEKAFLSDINAELINCYHHVKEKPNVVGKKLWAHGIEISQDLYYNVRSEFNRKRNTQTLLQAVRFLFLNRTSFNGIYRVNVKGEYNVPFGKSNPYLPTIESLTGISKHLAPAEFAVQDFTTAIEGVEKGALAYLDPPYPKISATAYFKHYSIDRFSDEMQSKVAECARKARDRGAKVVVSNADTPEIRNLYKGWKFFPLEKYRFVSCKSERLRVDELIIRSY